MFALLLIPCLFISCKDLEDFPLPQAEIPQEGETKGIYILCEGLYAQNSSSLAYYSFSNKKLTRDIFLDKNGRQLGDTANDMQQYGSNIYIVIDNSGTIEIIDAATGLSKQKILLRNAQGRNRHPRYITFHESKAYVACFDSTVCRIDTATFAVEAVIKAGAYPDGICVANNKLYVSNSGDRNSTSMGNTVSVISIPSFSKIKEITVAPNPYRIMPDSRDNVYLASRGSYNGNGPYVFQRIDTQRDEVAGTYSNIEALNFTIHNDTAYIYNYNFVSQTHSINVFDCWTEKIIDHNFIKDGTKLQTPYGIAVNRSNGDVYITDAGSFTGTGDVYCFAKDGTLKFPIPDVGLNPNAMLFASEISSSTSKPTHKSHISRVIDYRPAPGQFIGDKAYLPMGKTPETATYDEVLARISEILIGSGGAVSLGGWGGYITLGFDEPIKNISGKYDFKVYGNAYYNEQYFGIGGNSEPGIVLVSKDVNGNGIADDEWYELAGSECRNPKTIHNYSITYYKPNPINGDVMWRDNQGATGYIPRNNYHKQSSYFPLWENADELVFHGSRLPDNGVLISSNNYLLYTYSYGYADNHPNDSEFSNFDINWAVDASGNSVQLDEIHFIRIYTAVNQVNGWIGETSTEVSGIENLHK